MGSKRYKLRRQQLTTAVIARLFGLSAETIFLTSDDGDVEIPYSDGDFLHIDDLLAWATYYHRISTDRNPHHDCPDGPDTWCKYNKDPTSYKHHNAIPSAIALKIKPCYAKLTGDTILSKYLHGEQVPPWWDIQCK